MQKDYQKHDIYAADTKKETSLLQGGGLYQGSEANFLGETRNPNVVKGVDMKKELQRPDVPSNEQKFGISEKQHWELQLNMEKLINMHVFIKTVPSKTFLASFTNIIQCIHIILLHNENMLNKWMDLVWRFLRVRQGLCSSYFTSLTTLTLSDEETTVSRLCVSYELLS